MGPDLRRYPRRLYPVRPYASLAPFAAWRKRAELMQGDSETEWARLAPWAAWRGSPRRDDRQISLLVTRQQHGAMGPWAHALATCYPAESSALDPFDIATQFPLYVQVDPPDPRAQEQISLGLTLPGQRDE